MKEITWNDLKNVCWTPTLKLAAMRFVAAALIWTACAPFLPSGPGAPPPPAWHQMLIIFPVLMALALPVVLICQALAQRGVPWIGLVPLMASFSVAVGDPILLVLDKMRPGTIPLENFKFMNFAFFILVLKPTEKPSENADAEEASEEEGAAE